MSLFHPIPCTSVLLFLLILLIAPSFDMISCAPFLNERNCPHFKYSNGSLGPSNLAKLLADLPRSASQNGGFVNASVGQGRDKAFGLAICLAGFPPSSCQDCVESVVQTLNSITRCINSTNAVKWTDHCMVHHANHSFFGIPNTDPFYSYKLVWGYQEPNGGGLETTVYNLIKNLSATAANNETRFALGQDNYLNSSTGNIITIYGLAQCTRDLSAESCSTCLANYTGVLKILGNESTYTGGRVVGQRCFIWYDNKPFDNITAGSNNVTIGSSPSSPPPIDGGT